MRINARFMVDGVGWNRRPTGWVHQIMSIDKESDGRPEVDFTRRTTKVNLVIIIMVGLFYLIGALALWWLKRRHGA
jgi:hypothetical protein